MSKLKISENNSKNISEELSSYFQETYLSIDASIIDKKKEIKVLQKKLKVEKGFLDRSKNKLKNDSFLKQAPKNIVIELRRKVFSNEKIILELEKRVLDLEKL